MKNYPKVRTYLKDGRMLRELLPTATPTRNMSKPSIEARLTDTERRLDDLEEHIRALRSSDQKGK